MRLGLHAIGVGSGARRDVIETVATVAERVGFATLWAGEHVVMVDEAQSRYPYSSDGKIAVPAVADWLDPFVALSFAAAATQRVRVATGVLLLPEHNPVIVAKRAASLDSLSGGRLVLGVGVGWSQEEFDALGIPFARRGSRTDEYVEAMRVLWREDVASFAGEFVSFASVRVNPKPVNRRHIPIVVGGNSEAALRRVARIGDGWYGFNLSGVDAVRGRLTLLRDLCRDAGRDFKELDISVSLEKSRPEDLPVLGALGVHELVLVAGPPEDAGEAEQWVATLAERWNTGERTARPKAM